MLFAVLIGWPANWSVYVPVVGTTNHQPIFTSEEARAFVALEAVFEVPGPRVQHEHVAIFRSRGDHQVRCIVFKIARIGSRTLSREESSNKVSSTCWPINDEPKKNSWALSRAPFIISAFEERRHTRNEGRNICKSRI